jgi:DNA/RNA endonuclease G (NUC1)
MTLLSSLRSRLCLDSNACEKFGFNANLRRTSVYEDNPYTSPDTFLVRFISDQSGSRRPEPSKGDYAVPTLFNGDFDAIAVNMGTRQSLPGWNLYNWDNSRVTPLQSQLSRGVTADNNSYSLMLGGGAGNSATHNPFLVPDWGALRFDLHVPSLTGGRLNVTLEATDGSGSFSSWVNLTAAAGNAPSYLADTQRIGYGTTGFETFTVDVPDRFRGKAANVRFELKGTDAIVYLDDIGFKSQHLFLGNPTEARHPDVASPIFTNYTNNYLLEKPQYAVSYNSDTNIPNWVAWQLNDTWRVTRSGIRLDNFTADTTLPNGFYQVARTDYTEDDGREIRIVDGATYIKGHMVPSTDRNRNKKDNTAVNLMSNIVPQQQENNNRAWKGFEGYVQALASGKGKEVYVIAGTKDIKKLSNASGSDAEFKARGNQSETIKVPAHLWKVILVLDRGQGLADVKADTYAIGFYVPNEIVDKDSWRNYTRSVDFVEGETGYNFFSNLSPAIQKAIEANSVLKEASTFSSASLLASFNTMQGSDITSNTSVSEYGIGQESYLLESSTLGTIALGVDKVGSDKDGSFQGCLIEKGPTQIGSGQIRIIQPSLMQPGIPQISIDQNSFIHGGFLQSSSPQISTSQIGTNQINPFHVNILESGSTQVGSTQIARQGSSHQIGSAQIGSSEIGKFQSSPTQVNSSQVNLIEIPFPSSISLQQFLSSHNYTLQNTTVPTWLSYLGGTTPFNLNIAVTDLPTGQLAEAQLTGFAANGTPNAGTLLLDYNGNDLGWFIDPTPWKNSEFTETLTTTAYRANSTSAWEQRGAAQILNGGAALSEASPYLSNFKQTFFIPEGARSLQFTLKGIDPDASDLAPGDAFEAALLNAQTLETLVGSANGLSQTDAFLNLQHTGNAYYSIDDVRILTTTAVATPKPCP